MAAVSWRCFSLLEIPAKCYRKWTKEHTPRACESGGARWLNDWQHGYRPRSGHDYEKEYSTWDNHHNSKTLTSSVNLWLGENNIIQGVEDSPRKERVLERAETMASHWPVLLTKQPVTSVDWSMATGWKPNFVEQKCWWRNPPNHRDLPRRERSKGTDWVWSGPKLLKRRSGK